MRLGTKFSIIIATVLGFGLLANGIALWQILQQRAQTEIATRGEIVITTMNSVRAYTSNHISPLLNDDLLTEPEFIAETVPAFSAREVFELFRQQPGNEQFFYKEATINPTNPRDQADPFELDLIMRMRENPNLTEVTNYRELNGEQLFFIARPLAVTSESCLQCHSDPDIAPQSLISTYGRDGGFGWELNEIVATQIIYVPIGEIFTTAQRSFLMVFTSLIIISIAIIIILNYLLHNFVINPINVMAQLTETIRADKMTPDDLSRPELQQVAKRADELGSMTRVLKRMAHDVYERTQKLKQAVQALNIEIDTIKRDKQVANITESDFFQDIQTKARRMRRRHHHTDDDSSPTADNSE
ncbi:MAG TPA: DUF3365 domain-containing protein [Anaerolineae bacterium]|nr:DUF3365 domain-containing protein [Anaerolineae bacterium]